MLVANDDAHLADTLTALGPQLGITVILAPRGKLVARARTDKPSLVVLDVSPSDGLELLSLLKSGRTTTSIPVVVVAEDDDPELRELALDLGAAGFISQPLPADFGVKLVALMQGS